MNKTDFQNGFALGWASGGVVEVVDTTEIDNLETLIDESGVLEDTEGSVTEKVEQLIEYKGVCDLIFKTNNQKIGLFGDYEGETLPENLLDYSAFESLKSFARNSKITHIDFYLNTSNSTTAQDAFSGALYLKTMVGVNTSKCTSAQGMLYNNVSLETIQEPFDFSNITASNGFNYWLTAASQLKEIRFVAETIKVKISFLNSNLLTDESIQSIVDGLATVETAQTLTLHKDIVLTDAQKATINAKGWTLVQ